MAMRSHIIWRFGALAALILCCAAWSGAQPPPRRVLKRESERRVSFLNGSRFFMPSWQGRALLGMEINKVDEPVIVGVDQDGRTERIGFSIPGAGLIGILGLAGAGDGTIAAVGVAYDQDGQPASFLARIPPDRSRKLLVQLGLYVADAVTIAADGTMWTVGVVGGDKDVTEYNVLKRFDASGMVLATKAVRAQGTGRRGRDATETSLLRSSKDRVGWLTNANEYIEFGLDGNELGRYPPPPGPPPTVFTTTFALSENNTVIVGTPGDTGVRVSLLNRKTRSWERVELPGAELPASANLGFDGDKVVVVDNGNGFDATIARYAFSASE